MSYAARELFEILRVPSRAVLLSGVLALAACSSGGAPGGAEPGIPLELAQHRKATISDVTYAFDLAVPAARDEALTGTARIDFEWNDPDGRPLVLDFMDPAARVGSATLNGAEVAWEASHDHLVFDAGDLVAGARNEIELSFTVGDGGLTRSDDFLYTLFVPDRAHFSLPVFDQPDLKARVRLALEVPEGWVAVGNGPAVEASDAAADAAAATGGRHVFDETEPIPTYLIAFAAGRFSVEEAERDGRRYVMYHRETDSVKVARNRDPIFDLVASSMAWMEDYTGIDYPFAKYDFVLIPSFQYGGMEHPGAVFYRQASLMLDESATQMQQMGRASLIAHETAHMWFGDLVTMQWFDDVWTKEVFANFLAAKMVQPSFPEVDHELRFLLAHHPSAYAIDRSPGANAIRQPLDNLVEAGTLYGPIIYQKAPIVMRQLEARTGEGTLRDGLRQYLSDHAYGNATWPALIEILQSRVPGDLVGWSRVWVEEPGRPVISLVWEYLPDGSGQLAIRQSDAWGRGRVWPQVLQMVQLGDRLDEPLGSRRITQVNLDGPELDGSPWRGRVPPRWILPNGSGIEYGLFVLEDDALANMMADLPRIPRALDRASAWMIVRDAMLAGQIAPAVVREVVLEALASESDEQLVGFLTSLVADIHWRLISDEERVAGAPALEAAFAAGLERATTPQERSLWFGAWRRVVTTDESVARLRRIWAGDEAVEGLSLSEDDFISMATMLALLGVDDAEAVLDTQRERITNPDRLARFDFVRPALSADPAVRQGFFDSLRDPANREREPWVLAGLDALHHPMRRDEARSLVGPSLDLLREIQRTGDIFFPARWLDATLSNHNHPEVVGTVIEFLARERTLPERLRAKVLQSADPAQRAAAIVYGSTVRLPGPVAR